jgi:hypothetical protein
MELKKTLGCIILIVMFVTFFLTQTFIYMDEYELGFWCCSALTIGTWVLIAVITILVHIVMDWFME